MTYTDNKISNYCFYIGWDSASYMNSKIKYNTNNKLDVFDFEIYDTKAVYNVKGVLYLLLLIGLNNNDKLLH